MEFFRYKNEIVGFRMKKIPTGSKPITDGGEPLQLVSLKHKKGAYLKAHRHVPKMRKTENLQECLVVKKGKIKIDLYGNDGVCFKKFMLKAGELFLLMNGGIGIHFIDDAEIFELKNGPFVEDKILI